MWDVVGIKCPALVRSRGAAVTCDDTGATEPVLPFSFTSLGVSKDFMLGEQWLDSITSPIFMPMLICLGVVFSRRLYFA